MLEHDPGHPRSPRSPRTSGHRGERIEPHVERIQAAAADAFAPNTRRAYRTAWAGVRPVGPMAKGSRPSPLAPAAVAAYLAGPIRSGSTLTSLRSIWNRFRRSVIAHIEAGEADPAASEGVRRVLPGPFLASAGGGGEASGGRAHRRSAGRDPRHGRRSPRGFRPELDGIPHEAARIRGAVDVALASRHAGRHAPALRSGRARTEADVELRPDGSGRLRVRRSKTDQEGEGAVQYLGKRTAAAVREIRTRIRTPACSASSSGRSVARRLAAMARGSPGSKARSVRTLRPRRDGPRSRWPPGPPSSPSRSRVGGLPPGCPPTTNRGELIRTQGLVARFYGPVRVPSAPRDPRRKAAGSPLTAFGLADGSDENERGDVRAGRGRYPSPLASVRSGSLRSPATCIGSLCNITSAHKTRALDRYDPEFRIQQAEDLFERVKDRVGEKRAVRFMGSYSIRAYCPAARTVPLRLRDDHHPGGLPSGHLCRLRPAVSRPDQGSTTGLASLARSRAMDPGRPRADDQNHLGAVLRGSTGRPGLTWTRSQPRSPRWCWNSRPNQVGGGLRAPPRTYGSRIRRFPSVL